MLDIKRGIWDLRGWGARTRKPDTGGSERGRSDSDSFTQGGVALHPSSCRYGRRLGSLKVGRRTSGVHSGRDQPRPGISQRSTGAGCLGRTGIPRERRFHGLRASLRAPPPSQTPAACACGAELGGGRFPCVSAVTSARGVFSRGFPSRSPAGFNPSCAGVKAGKSELGICSSPVEGTGLAGPRGGWRGSVLLGFWTRDCRAYGIQGHRGMVGPCYSQVG